MRAGADGVSSGKMPAQVFRRVFRLNKRGYTREKAELRKRERKRFWPVRKEATKEVNHRENKGEHILLRTESVRFFEQLWCSTLPLTSVGGWFRSVVGAGKTRVVPARKPHGKPNGMACLDASRFISAINRARGTVRSLRWRRLLRLRRFPLFFEPTHNRLNTPLARK